MGDPDLIMDKIRYELGKGLPSKRKILSYLVDLLNKDKYPSLSDMKFYDIVGETYKLNLDYKLHLKMLFFPIYKNVKKKIKRLYGKEKRLEMEQYLIEKYGLYGQDPDKRQISGPSTSLDTKLRYCFSLLFLIIGLIMIFIGIFVTTTSSGSAVVAGITLMIVGIILILNSMYSIWCKYL